VKHKEIIYVFIITTLTGVWGFENIDTSKIEIIQSSVVQNNIEKPSESEPKKQENLTMPSQSNIININTSSKRELDILYKVGPKTADKIIEYREKNGKFKTKEEIMNVKGIGEKIYEKIKDGISVE